MDQDEKDKLIIAATLERLNEFRLPRFLALKKKVESGDTLSKYELTFLRRAFDDVRELNPVLERHPEYLGLRDKAIQLCEEILERDAENQSG